MVKSFSKVDPFLKWEPSAVELSNHGRWSLLTFHLGSIRHIKVYQEKIENEKIYRIVKVFFFVSFQIRELMKVALMELEQKIQSLYFLFFCSFPSVCVCVVFFPAVVCPLISQMLQDEEALDRLPSSVQSFLNTSLQPSNNSATYTIGDL